MVPLPQATSGHGPFTLAPLRSSQRATTVIDHISNHQWSQQLMMTCTTSSSRAALRDLPACQLALA